MISPRSVQLLSLLLAATTLLLFGSCSAELRGQPPAPVEQKISSLLELHTVEYLYRDIVYFGEQEYLLGFIRTRDQQLLFAVDIRVKAGIDLSDGFEVLRDPEDPARAVVRIPAAEVLLVDADESSIEQFFVRERGGKIAWDQVSAQMEEVKGRVREDAVAKGILSRAEENAASLIREVMTLGGFEHTTIQVRPPEKLKG